MLRKEVDCHTNAPDWAAHHCNDAESSRWPLAPAQASEAIARAGTPHQACDEIARHTRGDSGRWGGHTLGSTPTHSRNRTRAEGKSRPLALPTKRASLSKVSMAGKPRSRKNCATTSSKLSASKSPPTLRLSQMEVPASTKW